MSRSSAPRITSRISWSNRVLGIHLPRCSAPKRPHRESSCKWLSSVEDRRYNRTLLFLHRPHATESRRRVMRRERRAHHGQAPAKANGPLHRHALPPREQAPAHLVEAACLEAHRSRLPRRGKITHHGRRGNVGNRLRRGALRPYLRSSGKAGDAKVPEQADQPAGYRPTLEKSSINSSRT